MAVVTLNGTRLSSADTNGGWGNFNSGGPSPAAEPQLKYQGTAAVNKKVTSTTSRQGVQYTHGSSQNMSASGLWLAKMKVGDAGDLNAVYGCEVAIGSGTGAYYSYNVSGTGANNDQYTAGYNSQGGLAEGYIITAINPRVAQWREGTTGSPNVAGISFFGFAAQFLTGGAKSENLAGDAVDVGIGLDYNGAAFTFEDGADTDQNVVANRWGFACRNGSVLSLRGLHRVGFTAATTGTDNSKVLFPDGYHGTGDCGIEVNAGNVANSVTFAGTYSGLGRLYGSDDTRPDFTVTGSAGLVTITGTLEGFCRVNLTSAAVVSGASIECGELTLGGASLTSATVRCASASGVPVLTDFSDTSVSGVSFVQAGSGHAIVIDAPGSYSFNGLTFSGFGTGNAAAVYNNSGGAVTINVAGGNTPTVRNGAGATTDVVSALQIAIKVQDASLVPVSGALVYIDENDAAPFILNASTDLNGDVAGAYSGAPVTARLRVRKYGFKQLDEPLPLGAGDINRTVTLSLDPQQV